MHTLASKSYTAKPRLLMDKLQRQARCHDATVNNAQMNTKLGGGELIEVRGLSFKAGFPVVAKTWKEPIQRDSQHKVEVRGTEGVPMLDDDDDDDDDDDSDFEDTDRTATIAAVAAANASSLLLFLPR